ncbi:MAG: helix-turn-helix domain-containing protein, partial [Chloroflexi bacterium]|nr:helix-turn-helix domain-containing protein [Chloroflexota bacterium]
MESLLNANEIAEILGVSRATVFVLWSRNELPAVRIGKSIRCRPGDLADFIDANTIGANKNLPIAG